MNVALVIPPFSSLEFPSLEAGVVRSSIEDGGRAVTTRYLSHEFAERVGKQVYTKIANTPPTHGVADWVAAGALSKRHAPLSNTTRRTYGRFEQFLISEFTHDKNSCLLLTLARDWAEQFTCDVASEEEWNTYDMILICCRHQQLGFSLRFSEELRNNNVATRLYLFGQQLNTVSQAHTILDCLTTSVA